MSSSGQGVCQEVFRFIAQLDRPHECGVGARCTCIVRAILTITVTSLEFCGIWRVEYEALVRFIDEARNFGLIDVLRCRQHLNRPLRLSGCERKYLKQHRSVGLPRSRYEDIFKEHAEYYR